MKMKKKKPEKDDGFGIVPVSQVSFDRSFVYYGRSGTGKTTLLSSHPKPLLLVDFNDRGTDSIADVDGVFVKKVTSVEELEETYWYLKKKTNRFKTVGLDTMSALQHIVIQEIAEKEGKDLNKAFERGGLTKKDWGKISSYMKDVITNWRDLPLEVVFIAQDRAFNVDEEESSGNDTFDPEMGPALMPSVAKHLNASVMLIGNTFIKRKVVKEEGKKKREVFKYALRIGPNSVYITKIRKSKSLELPEYIVNPTYKDILKVIKGEE